MVGQKLFKALKNVRSSYLLSMAGMTKPLLGAKNALQDVFKKSSTLDVKLQKNGTGIAFDMI